MSMSHIPATKITVKVSELHLELSKVNIEYKINNIRWLNYESHFKNVGDPSVHRGTVRVDIKWNLK